MTKASLTPAAALERTLHQLVQRLLEVGGENILASRRDVSLIRANIGMVFQKPTPSPMSTT